MWNDLIYSQINEIQSCLLTEINLFLSLKWIIQKKLRKKAKKNLLALLLLYVGYVTLICKTIWRKRRRKYYCSDQCCVIDGNLVTAVSETVANTIIDSLLCRTDRTLDQPTCRFAVCPPVISSILWYNKLKQDKFINIIPKSRTVYIIRSYILDQRQ